MTNEEFIKRNALDGEIWKDVVGFEGYYMVSSFGRIASCSKLFKFPNGGIQEKGLRIRKQYMDKDGYMRVSLSKDKGSKTYSVHRIVGIAFIENGNNYPCIDHIDGDRSNNHVENLRWCTCKQNSNFDLARKNKSEAQKETYRNGRCIPESFAKRNNDAKIQLYAYTLNGDFVRSFDSASEASKFTNGFILHMIKKDVFYFKGYIFSKTAIKDFSKFPYKPTTSPKVTCKVDSYGMVIKEYKSKRQASIQEGIPMSIMNKIINSNTFYKGYTFIYK